MFLNVASSYNTGMSDLAANWAKFVQKGKKSEIFKISFLFNFAWGSKMNRKMIFKKPRTVTFGANLAQLGAKYDISGSELNLDLGQ